MTREEALRQYEDCIIMIRDAQTAIERLVEKKQNLRKYLIPDILPPSPQIKQVERKRGSINRSGETEKIVAKTLHDHGGKLSQQEIATLANLRIGQVNGVIYKLLQKNMIHKHRQEDGHVYFSIAVHKDRSELNHL